MILTTTLAFTDQETARVRALYAGLSDLSGVPDDASWLRELPHITTSRTFSREEVGELHSLTLFIAQRLARRDVAYWNDALGLGNDRLAADLAEADELRAGHLRDFANEVLKRHVVTATSVLR